MVVFWEDLVAPRKGMIRSSDDASLPYDDMITSTDGAVPPGGRDYTSERAIPPWEDAITTCEEVI